MNTLSRRGSGALLQTAQLPFRNISLPKSLRCIAYDGGQRGRSLLVSEIFSSVQGEGPNAGRPSVFVRLGIYNLSCSWCDTPYTWLFDTARLEKVRSNVPSGKEGTMKRPVAAGL